MILLFLMSVTYIPSLIKYIYYITTRHKIFLYIIYYKNSLMMSVYEDIQIYIEDKSLSLVNHIAES